MPAPLDLTGRRFGRLQVLERAGSIKCGRVQSAWRCLCECGREEILPLDKLVKRGHAECAVCRQGSCVVCSKPVPLERGHRNTCSDACAALKTRATQLDHYYRRVERDPEHNRKAHARAKARMAADPARAEAHAARQRERDAARWAALKADQARLEAKRARVNAWYAANAERIQSQRAARVASLDADAFERWAERVRAYQRAYRARWREDLRSRPQDHQQHLEAQREYKARWRAELRDRPEDHKRYLDMKREYRRQNALRRLLSVGQSLLDRRGAS